jgi:hypothetical protein
LDGLLKTGGNEATQRLELLIFSGNRDTKEDRSGTKHIGATDLLKEMTSRRTANLDWDDAAAIANCARSFRNKVAVWWQEVVPSDNSPKQLKKINTVVASLHDVRPLRLAGVLSNKDHSRLEH